MATNAGKEPRQLAEQFLAHLRDALLAVLAPDVVSLPDEARDQVADQGRRLGPAAIVRALDAIGEALLAMRDAPDPRVSFEVALVRVTRPELDTSPAAIVERLEKLERGAPVPSAERVGGDEPPSRPQPDAAPVKEGPAAAARQAIAGAKPALGAMKRAAPAPVAAAPTPAPPPAPVATPPAPTRAPSAGGDLTSAELTRSWGNVAKQLRPRVKGLFATGRIMGAEGGEAVFGFQSQVLVDKAEEVRTDVEAALAAEFGRPVALRLVIDGARVEATGVGDAPPPLPPEEEQPDLSQLRDAPPAEVKTPIDHLTSAFPGAEVLDDNG
jgi:DNA polymerase-3 subunit gamma/tau